MGTVHERSERHDAIPVRIRVRHDGCLCLVLRSNLASSGLLQARDDRGDGAHRNPLARRRPRQPSIRRLYHRVSVLMLGHGLRQLPEARAQLERAWRLVRRGRAAVRGSRGARTHPGAALRHDNPRGPGGQPGRGSDHVLHDFWPRLHEGDHGRARDRYGDGKDSPERWLHRRRQRGRNGRHLGRGTRCSGVVPDHGRGR